MDNIFISMSEALGFVTISCAVHLDGRYTYDIVLYEDEVHTGNALGLSLAEAREYLAVLFAAPEHRELRVAVDAVLDRLQISLAHVEAVA